MATDKSTSTKNQSTKKEAETADTSKQDEKEGAAKPATPTTTPPPPTPTPTPPTNITPPATPPEKKTLLQKLGLKKRKPKKIETEKLDTDQISKELYQQITEAAADEYLIIKLRKKTLLIAAGIIIILLWLSSIGKMYWQQRDTTPKPASVAAVPTVAVAEFEGYKIRVRYNQEYNAAGATELAEFLLEQPEVSFVDTAKDLESTYEGVSLVTKSGENDTRRKILILLESQYPTSTVAAQLTEDSNIDATVLFNPLAPEESQN